MWVHIVCYYDLSVWVWWAWCMLEVNIVCYSLCSYVCVMMMMDKSVRFFKSLLQDIPCACGWNKNFVSIILWLTNFLARLSCNKATASLQAYRYRNVLSVSLTHTGKRIHTNSPLAYACAHTYACTHGLNECTHFLPIPPLTQSEIKMVRKHYNYQQTSFCVKNGVGIASHLTNLLPAFDCFWPQLLV